MKIKTANKILGVALLSFAMLACSSTATHITVNTNTSNANATPSPTPSAAAVETAKPEALVADLYKQHDAKKSPFFQTKDRALVDKYFVKATADLIWKDAISSKGEVGALDGDPLYNAQDMEIKNFKIGEGEVKGDKAEVPVTFENFGKKNKLTYTLVKEGANWKIEDINYGDGYTLVKILKEGSADTSKK